jgi:uncharacterized membrane protein
MRPLLPLNARLAPLPLAVLATVVTLVLSACAENATTAPISSSKCPVTTLSRASADASAALVSSGFPTVPRFAEGGCDHRARIDVPLETVIDLNDNGEVLGTRTVNGQTQIVVWSKAGIRVLTPPPTATAGYTAVDLNNKGQVVGCAKVDDIFPTSGRRQVATAKCHAVIWDAQGNPTDLGVLGVPGANEARPAAINDAGTIVGEIVLSDGTHRAFVRTSAGVVTLITTPGTQSGAVAINEPGVVAGWYTSGSAQFGPWRAFSWSATGGTQDLGTLPSSVAGTETSLMPVAIDAAGDVVGNVYAFTAAAPTTLVRTSTFLYTPAKGMRDLKALSGIDNVVDVNAQGEILGWANLDGTYQPVTWSETRGSLLAVRFGWTFSASEGAGALHNINSWNEVLDSFNEAGVLRNVVWTWNPERYR